MDKNSKDSRELRLARAKFNATTKTIRLFLFIHGLLSLVVAILMTAILGPMFHLNLPMVFAGSLVGTAVFALALTPLKSIWSSNFGLACQEEQLWDIAQSIAMEGDGDALAGILEDRYPQNPNPDLCLKASQLQILMIRQGDLKKAAKLSEYLYRDADEGENKLYQASSLACVYIEIGRYDRGFGLVENAIAELEANNRTNSPCHTTSLMALVQGNLDLERLETAEKFLDRMKSATDACHSKPGTNITDQLVKMEASSQPTELAFYWYYLGRLKELKGSAEAELAYRSAINIMKNPALQKKLVLFYPELILATAGLALTKNDFVKAEKLGKEALDLYESDTPSRGSDYVRCKTTIAYARLKQGQSDSVVAELEECLVRFEDLLYAPHPNIATCLAQLGEAYVKDGQTGKARDCFQRSLDMRKRLLPANSPKIQQVENMLDKLPSAEVAAIS